MADTDYMDVTRSPQNLVDVKSLVAGDVRVIQAHTPTRIIVAQSADEPDGKGRNANVIQPDHWIRIIVEEGFGIWFWSETAGEHYISIETPA